MNAFTFQPAIRERVSLIIMLAGASGSGKTLSALKMARGLAGGNDSKIAVIDTEGGRAKHYAPARGEEPNGDKFAFAHGDLHAPFTPESYITAIKAADDGGFEVVVVDSCTHEWEGEGGLQDMHTELVERAVEKSRSDAADRGWNFNETAAADRASIGAWKEPKMRHKRFVSRLLQCRAHLILCFRADEKMRMETIDEEGRNGKIFKKTVIIQPKDMPPAERWMPICERRMPYEMTLSCILTPSAPGIPIPIKLQAQHRHAFPDETYLSEETGRMLAEWSRGGAAQSSNRALILGDEAAARGTEVLRVFWKGLTPADKKAAGGAAQLERWKALAAAADAAEDIGFDDVIPESDGSTEAAAADTLADADAPA